ncbi:hypothetical protein ACUXFS_002441 [Staphylococcus cohnii]
MIGIAKINETKNLTLKFHDDVHGHYDDDVRHGYHDAFD